MEAEEAEVGDVVGPVGFSAAVEAEGRVVVGSD